MYVFLAFLIGTPIVLFTVILILFEFIKIFQPLRNNRVWDGLFKHKPEIIFFNKGKTEIFVKNIRNAKYNPIYEFENKIEYLNKKYIIEDLINISIYASKNKFTEPNIYLIFEFGNKFVQSSKLVCFYTPRLVNPQNFSLWNTIFRKYEAMYILTTFEEMNFVINNFKGRENYVLKEISFEKNICDKILLNLISEIQSPKIRYYNFFYKNSLTEIMKILGIRKINFWGKIYPSLIKFN